MTKSLLCIQEQQGIVDYAVNKNITKTNTYTDYKP